MAHLKLLNAGKIEGVTWLRFHNCSVLVSDTVTTKLCRNWGTKQFFFVLVRVLFGISMYFLTQQKQDHAKNWGDCCPEKRTCIHST